MALINRLSKLVTADFHAVLDRIEEPAALLKQAIREMEEALANSEQRLKWLEHDRAQLETRAAELDQLIEQIDEELDICFDADQPDLAKAQIKRKLESQRLLKLVYKKRQQTDQALDTERTELKANRTRLDSMKQKAELFAEQQVDDADCDPGQEFTVSDDEVEVAFLREQQRRGSS